MPIQIHELRDGDEPTALESKVLESLNAFCAAGHGDAPRRSLSAWRWAYEQNPAGRRSYVALDGERVAGHFGALPHAVWLDGREVHFAEIVDAFVLPEYRRGLQTLGLFGRLGRALIETHGGVEGDFTYYGWPTPAEWGVGKHVLDYEVVRTQCVLTREPGEGPATLPEGVELLERFDHQARWLWDRCCVSFGASTIRVGRRSRHRVWPTSAGRLRRIQTSGSCRASRCSPRPFAPTTGLRWHCRDPTNTHQLRRCSRRHGN